MVALPPTNAEIKLARARRQAVRVNPFNPLHDISIANLVWYI